MTAKIIQDTCEKFAAEFFEGNRSERFRKLWPKAETYIERCWPNFGEQAIEVLSSMLGMPDGQVSPEMKAKIFDALERNAAEMALDRPQKVGRGPMMLRPDRPGTMEQHLFWRQ